jgi:CRP/FNR family cyclic AMP-dependent transcriptional regulator
MIHKRLAPFKSSAFFTRLAGKHNVLQYRKGHVIFSEGDAGDAVFYIRKGWVTLAVTSPHRKERVVAILEGGDLFGEACLGGQVMRHATATALEDSSLVRIGKRAMRHALRRDPGCSERFVSYLLSRNLRIEADLVAQLSSSSEHRLARVLLLLVDFGKTGKLAPLIPKINQDTLADMVGTTRSRVSFFLNRFRRRGFINYNGRMRVHRSLRTVVRHD